MKYKCYWSVENDVVAEPQKKMVSVSLTPDAEINREALDDIGLLEGMEAIRKTFDAKLLGLTVEQGSDAANVITRSHDRYAREREERDA